MSTRFLQYRYREGNAALQVELPRHAPREAYSREKFYDVVRQKNSRRYMLHKASTPWNCERTSRRHAVTMKQVYLT